MTPNDMSRPIYRCLNCGAPLPNGKEDLCSVACEREYLLNLTARAIVAHKNAAHAAARATQRKEKEHA